MADILEDGTLSFLPVRLNNQPVVMGGLTADEMWATIALSAGSGLVLGIPMAGLLGNWALVIVGGLAGGVLGLTVASRVLRRMKRGRPATWAYRQLQFNVALHFPAWSSANLITRSGAWTCRRKEAA